MKGRGIGAGNEEGEGERGRVGEDEERGRFCQGRRDERGGEGEGRVRG